MAPVQRLPLLAVLVACCFCSISWAQGGQTVIDFEMEKSVVITESKTICLWFSDFVNVSLPCNGVTESTCPTFTQVQTDCSIPVNPVGNECTLAESVFTCVAQQLANCTVTEQVKVISNIESSLANKCPGYARFCAQDAEGAKALNPESSGIVRCGWPSPAEAPNSYNFTTVVSDCLQAYASEVESPWLSRTILWLRALRDNVLSDGNDCLPTEMNASLSDIVMLILHRDPTLCEALQAFATSVSGNCFNETGAAFWSSVIFQTADVFCAKALPASCDVGAIDDCFTSFTMQSGQNLSACVSSAANGCPNTRISEYRRLAIQIMGYFGFSGGDSDNGGNGNGGGDGDGDSNGGGDGGGNGTSEVDTSLSPGCNPTAAIDCLLDVQCHANQAIPDWTGICGQLNETEECALNHLVTCDTCVSTTTMDTVTKMNQRLRKICEDPPVTECHAYEALTCVEHLEVVWRDDDLPDELVCVEITKTEHCVLENVEKCDSATQLSVLTRMRHTIHKWEDLVCNVDEQLKNCLEIFQENVNNVFSVDVDSLIVQMAQNASSPWDLSSFFNHCDHVEVAWSCVTATLTVKGDDISTKIMQSTLTALYQGVHTICEAPKKVEPPTCYTCQGQGQHACSNSEHATTQCSKNEVCYTVTKAFGNEDYEVDSKGCRPEVSCAENQGCNNGGQRCLYCCRNDLCNDLVNGPIAGGCDYQAVSACIMELSQEYIETQAVKCSSVDAAVQCVNRERLECQFAGEQYVAEAMSSLDVSVELDECRLKEADVKCEITVIMASINLISSYSLDITDDEMCSAVNESRALVAAAEEHCSDEEYSALLSALTALESLTGALNCDSTAGFVIDPKCRPVTALSCTFSELNITRWDEVTDLTCTQTAQIDTCMGQYLLECSVAPELFLVTMKQAWLLQRTAAGLTCESTDFVTEDSHSLFEIYACIRRYSAKLVANPADNFFEAALELRSCLFELDVDYYRSESRIHLWYIHTITSYLQIILSWRAEIDISISVNLTDTCTSSMNSVITTHGNMAFILPFLSIREREDACLMLSNGVDAMMDSCAVADISGHLHLLDLMREKLMLGYCPHVRPIARCYLSEAKECLARFSSWFDIGADHMCQEASEFVACAESYTAMCVSNNGLIEFKKEAQFVVSFVSQSCWDWPELVNKTRCILTTTEVISDGACELDTITDCTQNATTLPVDCSLVFEAQECFKRKIAGCSGSVQVTFSLESEVTRCETEAVNEGNSTTVIVNEVCEAIPYTCDEEMAKQCLVTLISDGPSTQANIEAAKECLERHYYCFASLMTLARLDIRQFSVLIIHFLEITPSWSLMESRWLIQLLTLPQYISPIIEVNWAISLNLYDICWRMHQVYERLQALEKNYKDIMIPGIKRSIHRIEYMISVLCNNFNLASEVLVFPDNGIEDASCPVMEMKARIDFMFASAITEFYRPNWQSETICDQYWQLVSLTGEGEMLANCSSGFTAQVRFSLKAVHAILGSFCSTTEVHFKKRCDVVRVKRCVKKLYKTIRNLGKSTTKLNVCSSLEYTEKCVEASKYNCDTCAASRIHWLFTTAKAQAIQYCPMYQSPPKCSHHSSDECDTDRAASCSLNNLLTLVSKKPLSQQCRDLSINSACISDATETCENPLQEFLGDAQQVQELQTELGCTEEDMNVDEGCTRGCNLLDARECFHIFHQATAYYVRGNMNYAVCQEISALRICVNTALKRCKGDTAVAMYRQLYLVLEDFPDHEETCVDVLQCVNAFDALVWQIRTGDYVEDEGRDSPERGSKGGSKDKDSKEKGSKEKGSKEKGSKEGSKEKGSKEKGSKEGSKEKGSKEGSKEKGSKEKGSKEKGSKEGSKEKGSKEKGSKEKGSKEKGSKEKCSKEKGSKGSKEKGSKGGCSTEGGDSEQHDHGHDKPGRSLTSLCIQARQQYNCIQGGLSLVPAGKRRILGLMYAELWTIVQEKCQDTSDFFCYRCKNAENFNDCLQEQQVCSHNKQSCYVFRKEKHGNMTYKAGCRNPKSCKGGKMDDGYCCYGSLCNDVIYKSDVDVTVQKCDYGDSLKCALDFTASYFKSDTISCSSAVYDLSCIMDSHSTCAGSLKKTASSIFLELAVSACVVEAESSECYSLSLDSMITTLSYKFTSFGQQTCKALVNAEASVNSLISSGKCSASGQISLQQVLEFVKAIVGSQCQSASCKTTSVHYLSHNSRYCSGHIFKGIGNIYKSYGELQKPNDTRDCGRCGLYSMEANHLLDNCGARGFLKEKMTSLGTQLSSTCSQLAAVPWPTVCPGMCHGYQLLKYAQEVNAYITLVHGANTVACWYLNQIQLAYKELTVGCSSVQQMDLSTEISGMFSATISACEAELSFFKFELEIKKDVYYDALMCQWDFHTAIEDAMGSEDPTSVCTAITEWHNCDFTVPPLLWDFLMKDVSVLVKKIEDLDPCSWSDSTVRKKREANSCTPGFRRAIVGKLNDIPLITTSEVDIRNELCQSADDVLAEADLAVAACNGSIPNFILEVLMTIRDHNRDKNKDICVKRFYEEKQCDLSLMTMCTLDLSIVDKYAELEADVMCRQAKMVLECMERFSWNCTGTALNAAMEIQRTAKTTFKQVLGNTCGFLTDYFYCSGSVDANQQACRTTEGSYCTGNLTAAYWEKLNGNEVDCATLVGNATCAQNAFAGCTADVLSSNNALNILPNLNNECEVSFSQDSICTSTPVCSLDALRLCFEDAPFTTCQQFTEAQTCVNQFFADHPWCEDSVSAWLVLEANSFYAWHLDCPFAVTIPSAYVDTVLAKLVHDCFLAIWARNGTAAEVIYTLLHLYRDTLDLDFEQPITSMLFDVVSKYTLYTANAIEINSATLDFYEDTAECHYKRATKCISEELLYTMTIGLLTYDEKQLFCDKQYKRTWQNCVTEAFADNCPGAGRFISLENTFSSFAETLGICSTPSLCIVSEGFNCVHTFGYALTEYDQNGNLEELCNAKYAVESCMDTFVGACLSGEDSGVRESYSTLASKVDPKCVDVPKPEPPICPSIPERNRKCHIGNAFTCLANFNLRLLSAGDSLLWREQCLNLQSMMSCVATNTTACTDVEGVKESLDRFSVKAAYRCPWLTDDLCNLEEPCPVSTAGCEVTLEQGLVNREKAICTLKSDAEKCVDAYNGVCNRAQIQQAHNVIGNKLKALGLPKDLTCAEDGLDGLIFNFLASVKAFGTLDQGDACLAIQTSFSAFDAQFANPNNETYLTLAYSIAQTIVLDLCNNTNAQSSCSGAASRLVLAEVSDFVSQTLFDMDFGTRPFCARSMAIIQWTKDSCLSQVGSLIASSATYISRCTRTVESCEAQNNAAAQCILNIDTTLDPCAIQAAHSKCIANNVHIGCIVEATNRNATGCGYAAIIQADAKFNDARYISESGLSTQYEFEAIQMTAISSMKLNVEFSSADPASLPKCVKNADTPIPQVYCDAYQVTFDTTSKAKVVVNAVQDFRLDGTQEVWATFTFVPYRNVDDGNGTITEEAIDGGSFTLPKQKIYVDDRDNKKSTCSSINDPHITTFDQSKFNNMMEGEFILYRSTDKDVVVTAEYAQCAAFGTCNCATTVYVGNTSVTISDCHNPGNVQITGQTSVPGSTLTSDVDWRIFSDDDLRTYNIVILPTETVVTVKASDRYMNIWIMPSATDFGATQGLCGVYDGKGYNDFEMRDFSQYKIKTTDNRFNMFSPDDFNVEWLVNNDKTNLFSDATTNGLVSTSCLSWMGDSLVQSCNVLDRLATCGYITGEDITKFTLESWVQDAGQSQMQTRKKRQTSGKTLGTPTFPTKSGITYQQARDYCMDNLNNIVLEMCREALVSGSADYDFPDKLDECIVDIMVTDSLDRWLDATREAIAFDCLNSMVKDPLYQNPNIAKFTDYTCAPTNCSGHGTCVGGVCFCHSNFYGPTCKYTETELKTPPTLRVTEGGISTCLITPTSKCDSIFVQGNGFIKSHRLSCHIQEIQITEAGITRNPSAPVTKVRAEMKNPGLVRCILPDPSSHKTTVDVTVSNDGVHYSPMKQAFMAYSPDCHSCSKDTKTCQLKKQVCVIGQSCVKSGATSIYEDCHYCDATKPFQWSILDTPKCEHLKETEEEEKDGRHYMISIALIATACTIIVLIVVLIVFVCYVHKKRSSRRAEDAARHAAFNEAYENGYYGQPAPAYYPREDSPSFRLQKMPMS